MPKIKNAEQFDFIKDLTEQKASWFDPQNVGVVFGRLSEKEKEVLLEEALRLRQEDSEKTDYRQKLAGNLNREYEFIQMKEVLGPKLKGLLGLYEDRYSYLKSIDVNQNSSALDLTKLWVNFMTKGDFNPPHTHSGVFSFVIWLKIPFDLPKELEVYPETNNPAASCFGFLTTNTLGQIRATTLPIDKSWEGVICLFPSTMTHFVNPFFTTDEERISIAGNLVLQNKV